VRELCNMAYYHHTSQFEDGGEDGPSVQEQVEKFEENIGQRISTSTKAEKMMRESMILRGLDPDAKPELSPELAAKLEHDALYSEKDIYFGGNMDREQRGKKITPGDDDFE